jgi:hypothetical protein
MNRSERRAAARETGKLLGQPVLSLGNVRVTGVMHRAKRLAAYRSAK